MLLPLVGSRNSRKTERVLDIGIRTSLKHAQTYRRNRYLLNFGPHRLNVFAMRIQPPQFG